MPINWGPHAPLELLEVRPPTLEEIAREPWAPFRLVLSRKLSYHERLVLEQFFQGAYVVTREAEPVVHWRARAHELSNPKRLAKRLRELAQHGVRLAEQHRAEFDRGQRVAEMANKAPERRLFGFGGARRKAAAPAAP
jgi:hypothetical protein